MFVTYRKNTARGPGYNFCLSNSGLQRFQAIKKVYQNNKLFCYQLNLFANFFTHVFFSSYSHRLRSLDFSQTYMPRQGTKLAFVGSIETLWGIFIQDALLAELRRLRHVKISLNSEQKSSSYYQVLESCTVRPKIFPSSKWDFF